MGNEKLDLIAGEADLALRVGALPDSNLVARKLGSLRTQVFASPAYIERYGEPLHPEELQFHRILAMRKPYHTGNSPRFTWQLGENGGELRDFPVTPLMTANDMSALNGALVCGEGLLLKAGDKIIQKFFAAFIDHMAKQPRVAPPPPPPAPEPRGRSNSRWSWVLVLLVVAWAGDILGGMTPPPSPTPPATDPAHSRRDLLMAMAGVSATVVLAALDSTIISTTLPRVAEALNGMALYAWVGTGYLLATAASILIFGRLGDMFGRKPLMLVSVLIIALGSIACGLAQSMTQLIVFRTLQGIGGGMMIATAFAAPADLFPDAKQRVRWMALVSAAFAMASGIGPQPAPSFCWRATSPAFARSMTAAAGSTGWAPSCWCWPSARRWLPWNWHLRAANTRTRCWGASSP
ncbi:hypothetical protein G6F31_013884 [Rhizopus arrhizus]|nr:hypothetical protein G6F31_013884 [Rhizopus arrhizus]